MTVTLKPACGHTWPILRILRSLHVSDPYNF